MEDRYPIVASCITLRQDISSLSSDLQLAFAVAGCARTKRALRRLPSELASLHLTIGAVQSSCGQTSNIPITLRANLRNVLQGCAHVVKDIREVLKERTPLEPPSTTEPTQVTHGSEPLARLLRSLEAHKSAVQIALELLLVTNTDNGPASQSSHSDLGRASQNTDQVFFMLREIRVLQFQVARLSQAQTPNGASLQRFLEDVSEYAEGVYQESDGHSMKSHPNDVDATSDTDDFHSAEETFDESARPSLQIDDHATMDNFELRTIDTAEQDGPNLSYSVTPQNSNPPTTFPSSSSLSAYSAWSYTSIRLRLTNRLYSIRTASDTARNVISALIFLDPAIRAVRLARAQGVLPLSEDQKAWIDQQILFAEQAMERAAELVEPARVDLQTRARVRFVRKVKFVLRDSPRMTACFEQLGVAGARLEAAANMLYGSGDADSMSGMNIPAPPYSLSLRGDIFD